MHKNKTDTKFYVCAPNHFTEIRNLYIEISLYVFPTGITRQTGCLLHIHGGNFNATIALFKIEKLKKKKAKNTHVRNPHSTNK